MCVCANMCVCIRVHVVTHMHVCVYVLCVYMYCMCMCVCTVCVLCVCVCMCMRACVHVLLLSLLFSQFVSALAFFFTLLDTSGVCSLLSHCVDLYNCICACLVMGFVL